MLDGILGRKNFKNKCKSALSRTKTRLDAIKRKRNAMQKFLKKDIADLLMSNLDRNAYGRAEGLYIELKLSSCYAYVEECCKCVAANLRTMHERIECPEECKIAVASLMYATARFADLPELRDLRSQFHDKYGGILEPYVSKEFVENLKSKPPTMEMKLQVMQEVAKEFSIPWDPKTLEHQLRSPSVPAHDHGASDKHNIFRTKSVIVHGKHSEEDGGKHTDEHTAIAGTKIRHAQSLTVTRGDGSFKINEQHRTQDSRTPLSSRMDSENTPHKKPLISIIVPAPYTIPDKTAKQRNGTEDQDLPSKSKQEQFHNLENGVGHRDPDTLSPWEKNTEVGPARKVRPRPKSVRTKFLKPSLSSASSSDYDTDHLKETFSARSSREVSFDLSEGLGDEGDEMEEDVWTYFGKISPKILSPSSAKSVQSPLPPLDLREVNNGNKSMSELPLPPGRRRYFSESPPASPNKEDDRNIKFEPLLSPGKSRFVPPEQLPKSPVERKVSSHSRSSSQSDDPYSHVHPRMPDFDELADRIAVLKQI